MVGAIDHVKHVTANQSSQAKRLQTSLKNVEVAVKAVEGVKTSTEKALVKANACVVAVEAKLGVFSTEKDTIDQALSWEKIIRANAEFALGREK